MPKLQKNPAASPMNRVSYLLPALNLGRCVDARAFIPTRSLFRNLGGLGYY
jgi:hypothetical protein